MTMSRARSVPEAAEHSAGTDVRAEPGAVRAALDTERVELAQYARRLVTEASDRGDPRHVHILLADARGDFVEEIASAGRESARVSSRLGVSIRRLGVFMEEGLKVEIELRPPGSGDAAAADSENVHKKPRPRWSETEVMQREFATEVACALRLADSAARQLMHESVRLAAELPATATALEAGVISYRHAQKLFDHAMSLPAEARAGFEESLLPYAMKLNAPKFETKARKLRERLHPESITQRRRRSAADRCAWVEATRDGMAWVHLYLPAEDAAAIHQRATEGAQKLLAEENDERAASTADTDLSAEQRTLTQIRVDLMRDLLVYGVTPGGLCEGITAQVAVTVPVLSLLGLSDEPATLEGFGPIDDDTAKRLVATATSFTRILTHPETGAIMSVGRERYAVPADLRRWLRVRDETCRFVGCSRAAANCDIDHTEDWADGGCTDAQNLAHLCRRHHRLKHESGWEVEQGGDGVLEWTSPAGRIYSTEPDGIIGSRVVDTAESDADPPPDPNARRRRGPWAGATDPDQTDGDFPF